MPAVARAQLQEFIALLDAGSTMVGGHNCFCVEDLGGRVSKMTNKWLQQWHLSVATAHSMCQVRWDQSTRGRRKL